MARGGARVGAGRPKGSVNGSGTRQVVAKAPAKTKRKASAPAAKRRPRVDVPGALVPPFVSEAQTNWTPLQYMLMVMNDPRVEGGRRDRMAVAAAVYLHSKVGEKGVKETRSAAAKTAGTGRFAPAAPPKLVAVGSR